jgi:hypothetical protein
MRGLLATRLKDQPLSSILSGEVKMMEKCTAVICSSFFNPGIHPEEEIHGNNSREPMLRPRVKL